MASYLDLALPIIEKDPDTGELKATPYFEDYLYQLVKATGGEGAGGITDLESSFSTHIVEAAVKQLQLDTARFKTLIKSVDYTAKNKDYVEGRGTITLKFPANAVRGDEVIFANGGGVITFNGNGNNIKYTTTDTTMISRQQGTSFHFHFFEDNVLNERYWRAK